MEELKDLLLVYKEKNNANNYDCAKLLKLSVEQIDQIEAGTLSLDETQLKKYLEILQYKLKPKSKKVLKILELFFRFIAMIMPLVCLLLCISNYTNYKILIVLLSIGVIATSTIMLPRNDK